MDLVLSDRPEWKGASVDVIDFKTGADQPLTPARMARGGSLQLGLYLAALAGRGIAGGRIWMLKPRSAPSKLDLAELGAALHDPLARLREHLRSGRFGALTPDRTDFSQGFEWPLACVPIPAAVLQQKHTATFGSAVAAGGNGDD
jgi:hypothetical protein